MSDTGNLVGGLIGLAIVSEVVHHIHHNRRRKGRRRKYHRSILDWD